jgi:DNA-binding transcriptional LysR family regulator
MIEGVTIDQLRTLRAVAEEGSFAAAARKLGRVQAAVSQSIDRLEAQLGLRLFDRSGRAPRMTRQGEAVADAAAHVQREVYALDALVASLKQGAETSLSIVVDAMFPTASLVAFAREFAAEQPAVTLVLLTELLSAVTAQIRQKRATWGIAMEDADMSDLERRHLASVRLVPVAAPSHPLASYRGSIDGAALGRAVQIVLGERGESAPSAESPRADHGILSPKTWRVLDLGTKHAFIAGGLGWGQMPEHVVRSDLAAGRLVELHLEAWGPQAVSRGLLLVWRRGQVMGPVARWAEKRLTELCLGEVAGER